MSHYPDDTDDPIECASIGGVVVPHGRLSPEALREIIEDCITGEMSEDWSSEGPIETKIAQVMNKLDQGLIEIRFDMATKTCGMFEKEKL